MEVIGFIAAAVVIVGLVLVFRSHVRGGSDSGRGTANQTRPDES